MTPRQLRSKLRSRLLSRMPDEIRQATVEEIEAMAETSEVDVTPAGSWVGKFKDTLCIYDDESLLAALVIQQMPVLDPLVMRPVLEKPALVHEFMRLRAEGILQGAGHDEYRVAVPKGMLDDYLRYLTREPETELDRSELIVLRRIL